MEDNIRMYLWGKWVYNVLVVKPEGKRPLGRPRRKCVFNIRMDLWEEGFIEPWSLKPEEKIPLGITRPRCVDNIRMDPWGEKFKSVLVGHWRVRDHLGDLLVDGWII